MTDDLIEITRMEDAEPRYLGSGGVLSANEVRRLRAAWEGKHTRCGAPVPVLMPHPLRPIECTGCGAQVRSSERECSWCGRER